LSSDEMNRINGNPSYILQAFRDSLNLKLKKAYFIILIDELETLSDNDKRNFDLILELLNINVSRFVKICVSNTLHLFSNINGNSLYVHFTYLIFKPYSIDSLIGIVKDRLSMIDGTEIKREDILSDSAIAFIVRKAVNHNSSDVRFILSITQEILQTNLVAIDQRIANGEKISLENLKINFGSICAQIDKKLNNEADEIIQKLCKPIQILLFAIYEIVNGTNLVCELVSLLERPRSQV
jgi:hypothetical protein